MAMHVSNGKIEIRGELNMNKSDIGLIGIAVMGENLVLNMASKGFLVTAYARKQEAVDAFLNGRAKNLPIMGTSSLKELVDSLKKPRKVMMMIKAGQPVDDVIMQPIPYQKKGTLSLMEETHIIQIPLEERSFSKKRDYYLWELVYQAEKKVLY
jgi:UDP-N-acetyl-D-mannosaminuronate dehydrogenase